LCKSWRKAWAKELCAALEPRDEELERPTMRRCIWLEGSEGVGQDADEAYLGWVLLMILREASCMRSRRAVRRTCPRLLVLSVEDLPASRAAKSVLHEDSRAIRIWSEESEPEQSADSF
jgi:hypothetical protein